MIVDRAIGLIHVYSRDETEIGRFVYFKKKNKEKLFYDWKRNRFRSYKKFYSFRGTFPDALSKLIDEDAYDKAKDAAIMSIDADKSMSNDRKVLLKMKYLVSKLRDIQKQE